MNLTVETHQVRNWWDDALFQDENGFDDASKSSSPFEMTNICLEGANVEGIFG